MNKKAAILTGLVFLLLAISWLGLRGFKNLSLKEKITHKQHDVNTFLKPFRLEANGQKPALVVYFNSGCEYCHWQMSHLQDNLSSIAHCQLFLFSHEGYEDAKQYLKKFNLEAYLVSASSDQVIKSFSGGVPQVLVYQEGTLKKHFKGAVKIEAILDVLAE